MKPLNRFTLFVVILLASLNAHAWDEKVETEESRNRLTISGDLSEFSVNGGSLQGTGVRVDFAHFLNQRSAIDVLISTSLTQGSSVSSTFTGFGAYYFYSPFSDCCQQNRSVSINGLHVLSEKKPKSTLFQVGLGVNEYLLNGSRSVYSASGLGIAANFTFPIWDHDIKTSIGYSQLTSDAEPVKAIFFTVGLGFNL